MKPKIIYFLITAFLFLLILPTLLFILKFFPQQISNDIKDWSAFGDYLNGTIGIVISLFTFIVTIIIAIEISKIDGKRIEENQKFEKQKLLREFREQEYKDIRNVLQNLYSTLMSSDPKEVNITIHQIIIRYRYFMTSNYHLFPFLNEQLFLDLKSTLEEFSKLLEQNQMFVDDNKMDLVTKFAEDVDKFNERIQKYLLEN